ncbi:RNA-directed DNA polymerase, eukaryota [Tanacetum coccineum]
MPPKRATTTAAHMSATAIEQFIEARVAKALANQEFNETTTMEMAMAMTTMILELELQGLHAVPESWFERMESVFHISGCTVENQVKFATCTLLGVALTWWNSHVKTVGQDAAYIMSWKTLMKMMTAKYCPRSEIKKLEIEIWNLKVKGTYLTEAIELANDLMDHKVHSYAERQAKNKRKLDNNNQAQQQPPKKQNVTRAYFAGPSEKKEYAGNLHLCNRWHYMSDCPELKNRNHGNQAGSSEARGRVYALGGGETDQDPNIIEEEIEA